MPRPDEWLAGFGLARYAELFAAQAIDLDILGESANRTLSGSASPSAIGSGC